MFGGNEYPGKQFEHDKLFEQVIQFFKQELHVEIIVLFWIKK